MFKQRLLTSLVLIPLVLLLLYFAPSLVLLAIIVGLVLLAEWEWFQLIPINQLTIKILMLALLLLAIGLSLKWFNVWLYVGIVLWAMIGLAVITYPKSKHYWGYPWIVATSSLLLLPLLVSSLTTTYAYSQGKDLLVYLLCLVWAADSGAYLAGKCCGRIKLIPQVSPGKTVEGTFGGILLSLLVALIGYFYFQPQYYLTWLMIALLIALVSIFGDLFVSILKRRCSLKDTGHLIPGHGGILDRLDSLIAAAPIFIWALMIFKPGI